MIVSVVKMRVKSFVEGYQTASRSRMGGWDTGREFLGSRRSGRRNGWAVGGEWGRNAVVGFVCQVESWRRCEGGRW